MNKVLQASTTTIYELATYSLMSGDASDFPLIRNWPIAETAWFRRRCWISNAWNKLFSLSM